MGLLQALEAERMATWENLGLVEQLQADGTKTIISIKLNRDSHRAFLDLHHPGDYDFALCLYVSSPAPPLASRGLGRASPRAMPSLSKNRVWLGEGTAPVYFLCMHARRNADSRDSGFKNGRY